jgi:hypothetical protein
VERAYSTSLAVTRCALLMTCSNRRVRAVRRADRGGDLRVGRSAVVDIVAKSVARFVGVPVADRGDDRDLLPSPSSSCGA